jgi:hypothetical protein
MYYACVDLVHIPHTESLGSETPHQQSQGRVRFHVNGINVEYANNYDEFIVPRRVSTEAS